MNNKQFRALIRVADAFGDTFGKHPLSCLLLDFDNETIVAADRAAMAICRRVRNMNGRGKVLIARDDAMRICRAIRRATANVVFEPDNINGYPFTPLEGEYVDWRAALNDQPQQWDFGKAKCFGLFQSQYMEKFEDIVAAFGTMLVAPWKDNGDLYAMNGDVVYVAKCQRL